jgi:radical SAM protein with 4Fe4S-binding SPASM domain
MESKALIKENSEIKIIVSPKYNSFMNKKSGFFARWGKTKEDDPILCEFGPEIADIEISTVCSMGCKFCYKCNTKKGKNMSFETFQKVFATFPKTLGQIAYGIGNFDANPDLWKIFEYSRDNGVIPNVTINGDRMTDQDFTRLAKTCGAVAVSRYTPTDLCYNAVQKLTEAGLKQTNIHQLLSQETYEDCLQALDDIKTDPRLKNLNAIVFLALKERGRGITMHSLRSAEKYKRLVEKAFNLGVNIGFDSCSCNTFLKAMEDSPNYEQLYQMAEPCESTLFSIYVDVEGKVWPCSFMENEEYDPVDLLEIEDFLKDCWHSEEVNKFRKNLLATAECEGCLIKGVRECPKYNLYKEE